MFPFRRWINNVKSKTSIFNAQQPARQVIYAPGTKITYDEMLIVKLKDDHVLLVKHFKLMLKAAEVGHYPKVLFNMDAFLKLFNAHALTEYTKLYIFLDHAFKKDEENYELIRDFKREMTDIGRAVRAFTTSWIELGIDDDNVDDFIKQAKQIGQVLVRRIKTEEERLYEIYDMAPSVFDSTSASH